VRDLGDIPAGEARAAFLERPIDERLAAEMEQVEDAVHDRVGRSMVQRLEGWPAVLIDKCRMKVLERLDTSLTRRANRIRKQFVQRTRFEQIGLRVSPPTVFITREQELVQTMRKFLSQADRVPLH
jgi:hypothetical protein